MSQQWTYGNPSYDHAWPLQLPHAPASGPSSNTNGMDSSGVLVNEAWGNEGAPTQQNGPFDGQSGAQFGGVPGPYQPRHPVGPAPGTIPRQSSAPWTADLGGPGGPSGLAGPRTAVPVSQEQIQHSDTSQFPAGMSEGQGEGQDGASSGATSLKRGMACTFCRRRKLKCSGERPKCASCIRYTQECEYAAPAKMQKHKALETKISELSDYVRQAVPHSELNHPPQHFNPTGTFDPSGPSAYYYGPPGQTDPVQPTDPYPTDWNPDGFLSFPNEFPDTQPAPPTHTAPNAAFTMTLADQFQPFSNPDGYEYLQGYDSTGQVLVSDVELVHGTPPPPAVGMAGPSNGIPPPPRSANHVGGPGPDHATMPPPCGTGSLNTPGTVYPCSTFPAGAAVPRPASQAPYVYTPLLPTTPTPSSAPVAQDQTNAQQKANAAKYFKAPRQASVARSTPSAASPPTTTTPDSHVGPPLNSTVDPKSPNPYGRPLPNPGMWYGAQNANAIANKHMLTTSHIDPIDGITESLGEFLFNPTGEGSSGAGSSAGGTPGGPDEGLKKKRKGTITSISEVGGSAKTKSKGLIRIESDGLTDSARELLLDCFLAHSRLFYEMSIPRFRYRMTFTDRRRPAPALLYAMYLWATRMSNAPQTSPMEEHFFTASCRALDISSANADRLIDCMRAAYLLSAYSYTSGRYHEGWLFAGMAVRLVLSTGLHQIRSCVYTPEPPRDPFLRGKTYLLPPPEDATELAERISTFWAIVAIERCGALATGFPGGISDNDVVTPFPRPFADIASRTVTQHDDLTIRDLYRSSYFPEGTDPALTKWLKATVILERASKLAFVDPEEDSEYSRAWSQYFLSSPSNPHLSTPPPWLDQPKYRCPKDYAETKLALDQLRDTMGVDGIFPVDRRNNAAIDGVEAPTIVPHTIMLHHQFAATHMFLHDINAQGVENKEALAGARRATSLIRHLPPLDIDSFCITIWSIIAKVLCKELRRAALAKDPPSIAAVEEDIDLFITEMQRVGVVMQLARSQAMALTEMKRQALDIEVRPAGEAEEEYPHRVRKNTSLPATRPPWSLPQEGETSVFC